MRKKKFLTKLCDKMRMGWFFIFLSIIMCIVLIGIQIYRIYPIWTAIPDDPWQGEPLEPFQSLIVRGSVTLDVLGEYKMHEVMIYKNGERCLLVEKFPVKVDVMEGDVLEVWDLEGLKGASLIVTGTTGDIILKYLRSSLQLTKGLHRICKVVARQGE